MVKNNLYDNDYTNHLTAIHLSELQDLGFSEKDCMKALKVCHNDVQDAAVWLTENCKIHKPKQDNLNITQVEVITFLFCIDNIFHGKDIEHICSKL